MEAFITHSVGPQILCHVASNSQRRRRTSPSQRPENVGSSDSLFRGQSLSPVSAFISQQRALVSTPLRDCGTLQLKASATKGEDDSNLGKDQPSVKKRTRRWWHFRQGDQNARENGNDHAPSGTDLWAKGLDSETLDGTSSTVSKGAEGSILPSEAPVKKEQGAEGSKNSSEGLFSKLATIIDNKRVQTTTVKEPETKGEEESWTEKILDVIVPNRDANKERSTRTDEHSKAATEVTSRSDDKEIKQHSSQGREQCDDLASRGTKTPIGGIRGIQELYQPPPKSSKDEESSKEGSTTNPNGKGNLVLNLIPWLSQKPAAEIKSTEQKVVKSNADVLPNSETKTEEKKTKTTKIEIGALTAKVTELGKDKVDRDGAREGENGDAKTRVTTSDKKTEPGKLVTAGSQKERPGVPVNGTTAVEVSSVPQKDVAAIRLIFGSETFFATETVSHPGGLIFRGNLRGEPRATLAKLEQRLSARLGDKYTLCLAEGEDDLRPVVVVVPTARDRRPPSPRQKVLALAIGFITLTTCFARGAYANLHSGVIRNAYGVPANPTMVETLFQQAPVSFMGVSIAIVVLISQLVQRMVAARRKTRVALPYLIPSYQLGSFGAVVQLSSPTPSRAALFDIAFSGALTLVVVSLVLLVQGLRMSTSFPSVIPVSMSMVSSSMLIGALTTFVPQGQILVDYGKSWIGLHPLAVIGANCLTIAALNLLPIRQLDGGRIVSAIYGRKTAVFASRVTIFFLLLASAKVPYYFVFLAAITFGPWSIDRPAKNELTEPNGIRAVLGYVLLLTMVTILLPHPASKFFGTG